jgi:twinkle protein
VAEEEPWERQERQRAWFNENPLSRQKKEYRKPKPRPASKFSDKMLAYIKSRGISEETLTAMKVTEGVEGMPRKDGSFKDMNTIQFNYYHNGELVNTKFRTGDKCFKMVSGAELLPYNIDSIKGAPNCIITEGEFDALSFYEAGYQNVVSVPNGANTNLEWLDDYQEDYFDDKETIYIASDSDTKGEVLKNELLRRFGVERCKVVEYGEGCKDANEHLVKYGQKSLCKCIENAKLIPVDGVFTLSDIESRMDVLYQTGLKQGATIGHYNFDEYCSFETKTLGIVTGIPNHGKSEWLDEMVYRLNLRYGWKWAYFSPENEPLELHMAKLVEKFVGKKFSKDTMQISEYTYAKQHINANFFFICPNDDYKPDTILAAAKALVRRYGIKGVVIDPYNYLEAQMEHNQNETQYISELLGKFKTFAKINDVVVIIVAHPAKMQKNKQTLKYDPPTLYDISGSAHFYNKADFGITVHRDFDNDLTEVYVQKVRFRHLGKKGVAKFKYNLTNGRYVPAPEITGELPQWDNTNHLTEKIKEQEVKASEASVIDFTKMAYEQEQEYEQQQWWQEPTDEEPPF